MIEAITLVNMETQQIADINTSGSYFVLDKIDWDEPSVDHTTFKVPNQIGESLLGTEIGAREPTITGYVVGSLSKDEYNMICSQGLTWEKYYQAQLKKIEERKNILNKIVNPLQNIRIRIGEYYMDGKPSSIIKYSSNSELNNEVLCKFSIDIFAFTSSFKKEKPKNVVLAELKGMFRFPLVIAPPKKPIVFGKSSAYKLIAVENEGDCNIGGVIYIKATNGSITNPKIYNVTTNEFIEVKTTLQMGEVIVINTEAGSENVIYQKHSEGSNISALSYISEGSVFLQFRQGTYLYGYDATAGVEFMEVSIQLDEHYFNLKEV